MDKTLLKAYIRTVVEEEVNRILPNLLGEAVAQIKGIQQVNETASASSKPKLDRSNSVQTGCRSYHERLQRRNEKVGIE